MTVVIPFFEGDVKQAKNLLVWIGQLAGCKNHPCVLVADAETPWQECQAVNQLAKEFFKSVSFIANRESVKGWIPGSCSLFRTAAEFCAGQVFLWLEPDAIPLKAGWLDEFENHYANCGKPFMGTLVYHSQEGVPFIPNPYLEGCGVYPPDCWKRVASTWTLSESWTKSCARDTVPYAFNTPLIHHLWGETGNPPTFADQNHPGTNVFCLAQLDPKAVLFHRNKDGSLIRLLRKRMGLTSRIVRPHSETNGEMRVVSLRRAGDIVALLPLLLHQYNSGKHINLVAHSDFIPMLEGVTYIDPIEWKGHWESPLEAAKQYHALNAQVYGRGITRPRFLSNFVKQAWNLLGFKWNRYWPLVFDNRDELREDCLAAVVFKTDKPKILLKLHGFSSPFPYAQTIRDLMRRDFEKDAEIVDLDNVKAERVYDLLGLMDRARCMVSVDTLTLHLNRSHRIPTIAFVNDSPWGQSPAVGNVVLRMGYRAVNSSWHSISDMIRRLIQKQQCNDDIAMIFSDWTAQDAETKSRNDRAIATWPALRARQIAYKGDRTSTRLGDPRAMPFIRDMVEFGFGSGTEWILALTNNDIIVTDLLRDAILNSCKKYGCYWAYRIDPNTNKTDNGVDVVAFTREWWNLHNQFFPDFLHGYCWWDDIMARIMQWSGCQEGPRVYYHETHPLAAVTRNNSPGAKWNDQLASEWISTYDDSTLKPIDL